jgi:putative addiction module killer protein
LIRVIEYLDLRGRSVYGEWLESLSSEAAAKVMDAVYRLSEGNFSKVEGVGAGVFERKIHFGPGYRIYFGKAGDVLIILLGGSSKQDQRDAIAAARERWLDYRRRTR